MPSIYQEQILDHYKYPRNFKIVEDAQISYGDKNPSCGDELEIFVKLDEQENVVEVGFQGQGCAISMSSASLLTEMLEEMTLPEIKKLTREVRKTGKFIPFLAFEWHSTRYGDHNVYYLEPEGEIVKANSIGELRDRMKNQEALIIPHHIDFHINHANFLKIRISKKFDE